MAETYFNVFAFDEELPKIQRSKDLIFPTTKRFKHCNNTTTKACKSEFRHLLDVKALSNVKNLFVNCLEKCVKLDTRKALPPRNYRKGKGRKQMKSFFDNVNTFFIYPFEEVSQRLSSYHGRWPKEAHIWPSSLASAGFYHIEDGELQCPFCSIRVNIKDCNSFDKPLEVHARLSPKCKYLNEIGYFFTNKHLENKISVIEKKETDVNASLNKENVNPNTISTNIPVLPRGVVIKYESHVLFEIRMKTFNTWKYGDKQNPQVLAECGYFYTQESDIVRCFCCDLGLAEWDTSDDPWTEHARHSPKCWFLLDKKGKDFVENVQSQWRKIYNPKHPAYDDKLSRMATFDGQWRTDIEQTSEILADAGFFYEGEEDVVRCHYCDGGLRHWEPDDIPWVEHARWFPFCKFVIKMKGREYVEQIKAEFEVNSQQNDEEPVESTNANPAAIKALLDMGFSRYDAQYAIDNAGNTGYQVEDLLGILIEKDEKEKMKQKAGSRNDREDEIADPETIREINKELKKNLMCVRCQKEERSILFGNCGHRVTCPSCADDVDYCPYCDVKIKTRLKTFLS